MVNWSSNLPFRYMILPSKSLNTNINRSNRDIFGMKMLSTDRVVGGGIVNDYRGEQIVVLVGNLQIKGTHQ